VESSKEKKKELGANRERDGEDKDCDTCERRNKATAND